MGGGGPSVECSGSSVPSARLRIPRELSRTGRSPGTKQQPPAQETSSSTAVYERAGNSKVMAVDGVGDSKA